MRKVPLAPDVDLRIIARGTPGFSGADLANLVNEAALLAARRGKRLVTHGRIRGRQGQGHDGRRAPLHGHDREEKLATAYHEAGHALVNLIRRRRSDRFAACPPPSHRRGVQGAALQLVAGFHAEGPMATFDFVLFVHKDSPLKTVQDVIDAAKKIRKSSTSARSRSGTAQNFSTLKFVSMAGLKRADGAVPHHRRGR